MRRSGRAASRPPRNSAPPRAALAADAEEAPPVRLQPAVDHVDVDTGGILGATVHRPAPRSRLLRMKERGLFKNG